MNGERAATIHPVHRFPFTVELVGHTGRSAARLARLLREQEVPGSNPGAPIFQLLTPLLFRARGVFADWILSYYGNLSGNRAASSMKMQIAPDDFAQLAAFRETAGGPAEDQVRSVPANRRFRTNLLLG